MSARTIHIVESVMRSDVKPIEPISTSIEPVTIKAPKVIVTNEAAELVRRDPTRAADVLSGWMSGKEDAA